MANHHEKTVTTRNDLNFEEAFIQAFESHFDQELYSFPGWISQLSRIMLADMAQQALRMELAPPIEPDHHFEDQKHICQCFLDYLVECHKIYTKMKN